MNSEGGTLRHVVLDCGHERDLWFFIDEPPMTQAMCLGDGCPVLAMRGIVQVGPPKRRGNHE